MFDLILSHKFVDHRLNRIKGIQINVHVKVDSMKYSIVRQKAGHVLSVEQSKRLNTYAESMIKSNPKSNPNQDKLIMIRKEDMVIKSINNKVSLGKIMVQANATNQNQLVRSNGHGAKKCSTN
jgi:hypothetical protein